jgi:predicted ATPase/DNA-binding SARP family transcriptional activator
MPEATVSPLVLRLLGTFEAHVRGAPLPPLRSRKVQWLLALLTLHHPAPVPRAWLAATLWPDSLETRAFARLRESLKELRRALGPEAERLSSPSVHTLSLDLTGAEVDLLAFDAAVAQDDPHALARAVGLYRGPLLEGCAEEWIGPKREAREQAYLRTLETLAAGALEAGDPSAAERHLRLAVAVDPLRESAQRDLMRALAAGGNHAVALGVYRELRVRLHRELHAEPDPETRALFEQIREVARFRGPTPPTASRRRPNLPLPRTPLLGREVELVAVQALLMQELVGLVTLTGTPGVGKTRLALEVAAGLHAAFAGEVWFVDLAPTRDAGLVLSAIATALGLCETDAQPLPERLKRFLRTRQRLLLLDNFEQVIAAAPLISELLESCPGARILVTSREALRLRAEQEFPVSPLALPDRRRLPSPAVLAQNPAVALFVQRAHAVKPDFALGRENAPAVAAICHRLEGVPLAIELAARRTKLFSSAELLARLENRLGLLVGGPRDLPARQQTLRNTIAWSYDLLEAPEKALFRRLGVFVGGCTLEAAAAVCNAEGDRELDILEDLASLVDKSLLLQEEGPDGEPRFRMLELIREYAQERLAASGEAEAIRGREAEYFMSLAETAEPELRDGEHITWLTRLQAEHDNMREALRWCAASGAAEIGLRTGAALSEFWRRRGYLAEGREFMTTEARRHRTLRGKAKVTLPIIQQQHVAGLTIRIEH